MRRGKHSCSQPQQSEQHDFWGADASPHMLVSTCVCVCVCVSPNIFCSILIVRLLRLSTSPYNADCDNHHQHCQSTRPFTKHTERETETQRHTHATHPTCDEKTTKSEGKINRPVRFNVLHHRHNAVPVLVRSSLDRHHLWFHRYRGRQHCQ